MRHQISQESSIFSRLAQHFPFICNLLRRHHPQSCDTRESYFPDGPSLSEAIYSPDSHEMPNIIPANRTAEGFGINSAELQRLPSNSGDEIYYLRGYGSSFEQMDVEFSERYFSNFYDQVSEEVPAFQRQLCIQWNLRPGYRISEERTNEAAIDFEATTMLDNISIFKLPVGVKPTEELKTSLSVSNTIYHQHKIGGDDVKAEAQATPRIFWDALTDAGFEAVSKFYDNASAVLMGNANIAKKQGVLSVRAASMLPVANICGSLVLDCCYGFLLIWSGPPMLTCSSAFAGFGHVSGVLLSGLFGSLHFPWSAGFSSVGCSVRGIGFFWFCCLCRSVISSLGHGLSGLLICFAMALVCGLLVCWLVFPGSVALAIGPGSWHWLFGPVRPCFCCCYVPKLVAWAPCLSPGLLLNCWPWVCWSGLLGLFT
ncbi:hypothetical protein U1Q18_002528, partial [Sarracenia purpurea var. burkii]